MANEASKSALITSQKNEMRKTRYFYDGTTGRPTYMVEAARDVADGGPCLVTKFDYADGTTLIVRGTVEYEGEWDDTWDIAESVPS